MTDKQKRDARDGDGDGLVEDGTEFERPEGFVIDAKDGDGDGMVQDGTKFERPVEEASVVPKAPVKKQVKKSDEVVPTVIPEDTQVELSKFVFESLFERNSRSVGLTQIRLLELGYVSAGSDKRGWLSTGTKQALEDFSSDKGITADYASEEVLSAVFEGTPVTLVP